MIAEELVRNEMFYEKNVSLIDGDHLLSYFGDEKPPQTMKVCYGVAEKQGEGAAVIDEEGRLRLVDWYGPLWIDPVGMEPVTAWNPGPITLMTPPYYA